MKFLKELKKLSLVTIAVSAVVGILFIAFPNAAITYLSLFVGISLIVTGGAAAIGYFVNKSSKFMLTLGIIVLIAGIIICAKYREIISLIVVIFGIFILASGIVDLITGIKTAFLSRIAGITSVVLSLVSIVFGFVAITKSAKLTEGIVQFIGVALVVYAIVDIIAFFEVCSLARDVSNAVDKADDIDTDGNISQ